jgi:transcriptional regulator with XRE-family HTH domain
MIGKVLKYMRTNKKINQKELTKILNIGQSTLSDYENEKISIGFEMLETIAHICDYKIYFVNSKTKDSFEAKDLERKDIK